MITMPPPATLRAQAAFDKVVTATIVEHRRHHTAYCWPSKRGYDCAEVWSPKPCLAGGYVRGYVSRDNQGHITRILICVGR